MFEIDGLIPILPLVGFIINIFLGRNLSKSVVGMIGTASVLISFGFVVALFITSLSSDFHSVTVTYFNWFEVGQFKVSFAFLYDRLSILMMLIITGVGSLIHIYSIGYMHDDEGYHRFFAYLNLFVFFMLVLVLGANYLITFIGWEGVGLCSYLLIGFWFKNQDFNDAAKKAFIMNRIGDLGLLLGIFLIFTTFGSINFADVFAKSSSFAVNDTVIITITVLLFIGAIGKSAQIPLFTWLPDAMAGPTPVSALIHAATMVTAGIYLIVRSNALFSLAPFTLEIVLVVGLVTALFAATIGLRQNDIKKVLAYSTVSQLGFMFIALGLGAYSTAFFHVMTHAFFKALLFLGAGSVIHAMHGEQDIRKMGGLRKAIPVTFWTFVIGTIAITGIPPFAGFFSKDEILAEAFMKNPLIWGFGLVGSLITAIYMFRLLYLVFYGEFRGTADQKKHLHESPAVMTIPLVILAIFSAFAGFLGLPEIFGTHQLKTYLAPIYLGTTSLAEKGHLSHSTEIMLMAVSAGLAIIAAIACYIIYVSKKSVPLSDSQLSGAGKVLANKYYIDEIYDALIVRPFSWLSDFFYRIVDIKVIDGVVNGVGTLFYGGSNILRRIQTGHTGFYIFAMTLGIVVMIIIKLVF